MFGLLILSLLATADAARLMVSASAMTPPEDIVLESSVDVGVSAFKLQAVGEPLLLTDFTLWVEGEISPVDLVTVTYRDSAGSTVSSSAYPDVATGLVVFEGQDMPIPAARFRFSTLYVSVDSGSVGLYTGSTFRINWVDDGVVAVGLFTGTTIAERRTTDEVDGMEMTWHVSKPTLSLVAGSPSGGGWTPGLLEVLNFNVAADSRGDIGGDGVMFEFIGTDDAGTGWLTCESLGDLSKWAIYNTIDTTTDIGSWVFYSVDGIDCSLDPTNELGYAYVGSLGETILAGSVNGYGVDIDVSGVGSGFDDGFMLTVVNYYWVDMDSGTATVFDGKNIKSIPLEGGVFFFGI